MSGRLPSWFWMLVCVASFGSSALAWNLERSGKARMLRQPVLGTTPNGEPEVPTQVAPPPPMAEPIQFEVAEVAAAAPATPPQATFAPTPSSSAAGGATVLRCVARGRVTYVDATAACGDGSPGKLTTLMR